MPTSFVRPSVLDFKGKKVISYINKDTFKRIKQLCKDLSITPYMLLLSCYY